MIKEKSKERDDWDRKQRLIEIGEYMEWKKDETTQN